MSRIIKLCSKCYYRRDGAPHSCKDPDRCQCPRDHYELLEPVNAPAPARKSPVLHINYGNTMRGTVTLREGDEFNVKAPIKGVEVRWV